MENAAFWFGVSGICSVVNIVFIFVLMILQYKREKLMSNDMMDSLRTARKTLENNIKTLSENMRTQEQIFDFQINEYKKEIEELKKK